MISLACVLRLQLPLNRKLSYIHTSSKVDPRPIGTGGANRAITTTDCGTCALPGGEARQKQPRRVTLNLKWAKCRASSGESEQLVSIQCCFLLSSTNHGYYINPPGA